MKFIKRGFPLVILKPQILFSKRARNIKFHFDLMHGRNNLDKAIDLLTGRDEEFESYEDFTKKLGLDNFELKDFELKGL